MAIQFLTTWGHALKVNPEDLRKVEYFASGWNDPDSLGGYYVEGGPEKGGGRWPSLEACYEARREAGEIIVLTEPEASKAYVELLDIMSDRMADALVLEAAHDAVLHLRSVAVR